MLFQLTQNGTTAHVRYLSSASCACIHLYSYQDRFWRKPVFEGVELIQKALDDAYGAGKVSMVSAALRWLCHHSKLSSEHHGQFFILALYHTS